MMPTEHELKEFANALQLSIKTKIVGVTEDDGNVAITFDHLILPDDENFVTFTKWIKSEQGGDPKVYIIRDADKINWPQLTLFLLLTRLNDKNISSLAENNQLAKEIIERLGMEFHSTNINSIEECSKIIFNKLKEKGMTNRELAESTDLTQVTVGNFKAGKDIKLSNLIKIIQALGLDMKIA